MRDETLPDIALHLFRKEKRNCAEAVIEAWQMVSGHHHELADQMRQCGSGEAPQGVCGAFYAAQIVSDKDAGAKFFSMFANAAGSILCREIRSAKKISCSACVKLAATFLEEALHEATA